MTDGAPLQGACQCCSMAPGVLATLVPLVLRSVEATRGRAIESGPRCGLAGGMIADSHFQNSCDAGRKRPVIFQKTSKGFLENNETFSENHYTFFENHCTFSRNWCTFFRNFLPILNIPTLYMCTRRRAKPKPVFGAITKQVI